MEEKLKELGLNEEQVKEVIKEFKSELDGKYVTKEVFNQKNEELKKAKEDITTRDSQIKDLEKFSKDNEELKNKISAITKENADNKAKYESDLAKERLSYKVRNEIMSDKEFKAHDVDLVLGMLNFENIKVDNDNLIGFKEQFDNLKKDKEFLFSKIETSNNNGVYRGVTPPNGNENKNVNSDKQIDYAKKLASMTLASKGITPNQNK